MLKRPAVENAGVLSPVHDDFSVDQYVINPFGMLFRVFDCCGILYCIGIKNDQVSSKPCFDQSPVGEPQALCRGSGQMPNHFL